ncbi:MAG: GH3 auxin-responsive promoter family protein, partial [Planctomycetota bacterium]
MSDGWLDSWLGRAALAHARRRYHIVLRAAKTAVRTQERVLREKIERNADSAFGREHGFSRIRSHADFAAHV